MSVEGYPVEWNGGRDCEWGDIYSHQQQILLNKWEEGLRLGG